MFSSMAAIYTSSFLRSLSSSIQTNNRLAPDLWQRLTSLGLSRVKPTRRGLRGGNRRRQVLPRPGTVQESSMGQPLFSYGSFLTDFSGEKENLNGESNLHTASSSTLNVQIDTLQHVGINNSDQASKSPAGPAFWSPAHPGCVWAKPFTFCPYNSIESGKRKVSVWP